MTWAASPRATSVRRRSDLSGSTRAPAVFKSSFVKLWIAGALVALTLSLPARIGAQPRDGASIGDRVVPVWRGGRSVDTTTIRDASSRGLLVIDLGEAWVPYVLSGTEERPHAYEPVFRAMARGEFPDSLEGHRARLDRYHELYGIPPTLARLRQRFHEIALSACRVNVDLDLLRTFDGTIVHEDDEAPLVDEADLTLTSEVQQLLVDQGVLFESEVDPVLLSARERRVLRIYGRAAIWRQALQAIRYRLACEGHLRGRAPTEPDLDRRTRLAIAEFERAHRIYSRGNLSGETLLALQTDPLELAREDVVRVVTERAILTAGIVEDGTAPLDADGMPRTYMTAQGNEAPIRDLAFEMRTRVVESLGLDDPEATVEWLGALGDLDPDGHLYVAIPALDLPEYYSPDMDLFVVIDRGDVWYDFHLDAQDRPVPQPVENPPTLTVYVRWNGQEIALARWGTTIGGWRLAESRRGEVWAYKESPVGRRIWGQIVSAPVWLPPADEPSSSLVTQIRRTEEGELITEVNRNLVGPGYASAYGLVAAYHRRFSRRSDSYTFGADEGIRTHGSVDYTSIWRKASHGCHRLHNHVAMRLFSFVLAHRPHRRQGHRPLDYRTTVEIEGREEELRIDRSGYVFALRRPIEIEVLPGRILGRNRTPMRETVPRDPALREEIVPEDEGEVREAS